MGIGSCYFIQRHTHAEYSGDRSANFRLHDLLCARGNLPICVVYSMER